MAYIHPDMALFFASLIVLGIFIRLYGLIEGNVRGFGWTILGITLFVLASFFNYLEETPFGYLMLAYTDEEGWDFIVPVFGYAPGGLLFCIGFAQWLRMAFVLRKEIDQRKIVERELEVALVEAGKANAAKDQFLAIMSHELRTPLTAIIGFSEIMSGDRYTNIEPEKYAEYSDIIRKSGEHLLHTIDDILALSEVEAHDYELKEAIFCLEEVLNECLYLLTVEAQNAHVSLPRELRTETKMVGDRRLIKQIFLNLLSNAIRFNRDNGAVLLVLDKDPTRGIFVTVSDTGVGMSAGEAKKALEPFAQLEDTHSRHQDGTGLGLTLAKKFTELHDGTFELTSQKGTGTDITVRFRPDRLR